MDSGAEALASIVQIDPIRVRFSLTDRAYLNLKSSMLEGENETLVAQVRLPNGAMLPMVGRKDFDDNTMNARTGTMVVRYLFDNPDGLLVSGGYVSILLGKEDPSMGIKVPKQAILVDADGTYVLTVSDEGLVGTARVTVGDSVEGDFVVLNGLQSGDRIVVDGVQKVQPGMTATVTFQETDQ